MEKNTSGVGGFHCIPHLYISGTIMVIVNVNGFYFQCGEGEGGTGCRVRNTQACRLQELVKQLGELA